MERLFTIVTPDNYEPGTPFPCHLPGHSFHTRWPVEVSFKALVFTRDPNGPPFPPAVELNMGFQSGHTFKGVYDGRHNFVFLFKAKSNDESAVYVCVPVHVVFTDYKTATNVIASSTDAKKLTFYGSIIARQQQ